MKRRFQFSLAGLLLGTAVAAVATNWWTLRQRLVAARDRFTEQLASYTVGTATTEGVIRASKELLQAELAMPVVPSDKIAWLSYLDRTRNLHRKEHATANLAMFDSMEAMRQTQDLSDELLDECHRIEDQLGLPHVDNDYFRTTEPGPNDSYEMDDDEPAPAAPED